MATTTTIPETEKVVEKKVSVGAGAKRRRGVGGGGGGPRRGGGGGPGGGGGFSRGGGDDDAGGEFVPNRYRVGMWITLAAVSMTFTALTSAYVVRAGGATD